MFGKLFKKKPVYKFSEPENTACLSCSHVIEEQAPILYVSHDEDDGGWQFLCGVNNHTEEDARMVSLKSIIELDPSINKLNEMPVGICAGRGSVNSEWKY